MVLGAQWRQELIRNNTLFLRQPEEVNIVEKLLLNDNVFVVRVWGGKYRKELIQNVTVFCDGPRSVL